MTDVLTLDEMIAYGDQELKKALERATSDRERAQLELQLALNPGWTRWVKESHVGTAAMMTAICAVTSLLLAEAISNITRGVSDKDRDELIRITVDGMGPLIRSALEEERAGTIKSKAMRRTDS